MNIGKLLICGGGGRGSNPPADFRPQLAVDSIVGLRELTSGPAVEELLGMAPFGFGNPAPVLAVAGAQVATAPSVVKDKHLRVHLRQDGRGFTAAAWNAAERAGELAAGAMVDAAFSIEEDAYAESRGWPGWSAVLRDFRAAESRE